LRGPQGSHACPSPVHLTSRRSPCAVPAMPTLFFRLRFRPRFDPRQRQPVSRTAPIFARGSCKERPGPPVPCSPEPPVRGRFRPISPLRTGVEPSSVRYMAAMPFSLRLSADVTSPSHGEGFLPGARILPVPFAADSATPPPACRWHVRRPAHRPAFSRRDLRRWVALGFAMAPPPCAGRAVFWMRMRRRWHAAVYCRALCLHLSSAHHAHHVPHSASRARCGMWATRPRSAAQHGGFLPSVLSALSTSTFYLH